MENENFQQILINAFAKEYDNFNHSVMAPYALLHEEYDNLITVAICAPEFSQQSTFFMGPFQAYHRADFSLTRSDWL